VKTKAKGKSESKRKDKTAGPWVIRHHPSAISTANPAKAGFPGFPFSFSLFPFPFSL
jgi:hypothetical protein